MNFSPKLLVLCGVIVAGMVFVVASIVGGQGGVYYLELGEFMSRPVDRAVRLAGFVEDGSIQKDAAGLAVSFTLRDQDAKHHLKVHFDARKAGGRIPDTFTDGSQVVVAGRLGQGQVFEANQMLAKCPSKYEAAAKGKRPAT